MAFQTDRDVTKTAAALLVGRTVVMAMSFVFVLYAARLLGLTGFGRYALARTYFDLLLTLGGTGLTFDHAGDRQGPGTRATLPGHGRASRDRRDRDHGWPARARVACDGIRT